MIVIFQTLLLFALFSIVLAAIKPRIFTYLFGDAFSRKKAISAFALVSLTCIVFIGLIAAQDDPTVAEVQQSQKVTTNNLKSDQDRTESASADESVTDEIVVEEAKSYEVVHILEESRFDGAPLLYVLVDEVDTSQNYKNDIRETIQDLINQYGDRISIEFYDDGDVLDTAYQQYGILNLNRTLTTEELSNRAIHTIAVFDGKMSTNIFPNTLSFFPAAFKDHPVVGDEVEIVEFNP